MGTNPIFLYNVLKRGTYMNLTNLLNVAWNARCNNSHEEAETQFKNLLSHGFVDMEKVLRQAFSNYDDDLFYMVQRILAHLIVSDGEYLQGEYDAYLKYCKWAGFKPLSVPELEKLGKAVNFDEFKKYAEIISATRQYIDEDHYECFVLSLCYMSLFGDKKIDENEYKLITWFLDKDKDQWLNWKDYYNL